MLYCLEGATFIETFLSRTQVDIILEAGGDAVLHDAGKVSAEFAKSFAESEFEKYRVIQDKFSLTHLDSKKGDCLTTTALLFRTKDFIDYCTSGKRGSNPRPPAWEASALPTELLPQQFD